MLKCSMVCNFDCHNKHTHKLFTCFVEKMAELYAPSRLGTKHALKEGNHIIHLKK
jgi:hypothetical protein